MRSASSILTVVTLVCMLFGCGCNGTHGKKHVGVYVKRGSPWERTDLKADGSFVLNEGGVERTGTYEVNGATLNLKCPAGKTSGRFDGDNIIDNQNNTWQKIGQGTEDGTVYFIAGHSAYRLGLGSNVVTVVCSDLPKTENLILDAPNNRLLLSTWDSGSPILAVDALKGGRVRQEYRGPGNGGQGFAYDEAASSLFFGLYYKGVYVNDLNRDQGWRQLVAASALSPMIGQRGQLVLDPYREHVYFRSAFNGQCDQCRYIWRVNYDGSGLTKIIPANGGDALAISLSSGHLVFSDEPGDGTIKRANLDGAGVEVLMTLPESYPVCNRIVLDGVGEKMYLYLASGSGERSNRAVARTSMDGSNLEILTEVHNAADGCGIAVVTSRPQGDLPNVPNAEINDTRPPRWVYLAGTIGCFVAALLTVVLLIRHVRIMVRAFR